MDMEECKLLHAEGEQIDRVGSMGFLAVALRVESELDVHTL